MLRMFLIRLNNLLVRKRRVRARPDNLLLLLPHCIQNSECDRNIIREVNNCERCGKCDVGRLLELSAELGVDCRVAGGGREALRLTRRSDVAAVVACACEKELLDGIRCAFPKPVLAVMNSRPNGPCKDTRADIRDVRSALMELLPDSGGTGV